MTTPPLTTTKHVLKIWPEFYREHAMGTRRFEIRKNDRGYDVGDLVVLQPYDPTNNAYLPGPELTYRITTVSNFQQRLDYVVLGLEPLAPVEVSDENHCSSTLTMGVCNRGTAGCAKQHRTRKDDR